MSRRFVVALSFLAVVGGPVVQSAWAQTEGLAGPIATSAAVAASAQFGADQISTPPAPRPTPSGQSWATPLLVGLQATTIASQMLDVHSTLQAIDRGAVEANPMMGGLVKNRAAFISTKAAIGAGLVYATHRLGQRNKVAAVVMAAAVNSAYLYVARHNYKVARALR